jgi:ElaB/YqjD/DUF883 family membrane-anchored ribosome-binding protein
MDEMTAAHKDKLMADLRNVISDAEEVLRVTADQASEGTAELRTRMKERLHQAKDSPAHLQATAVARAKAAGAATDDYVHENPWKAIGAAFGVGLIVGVLIGQR